jgi:hypothetical protein
MRPAGGSSIQATLDLLPDIELVLNVLEGAVLGEAFHEIDDRPLHAGHSTPTDTDILAPGAGRLTLAPDLLTSAEHPDHLRGPRRLPSADLVRCIRLFDSVFNGGRSRS